MKEIWARKFSVVTENTTCDFSELLNFFSSWGRELVFLLFTHRSVFGRFQYKNFRKNRSLNVLKLERKSRHFHIHFPFRVNRSPFWWKVPTDKCKDKFHVRFLIKVKGRMETFLLTWLVFIQKVFPSWESLEWRDGTEKITYEGSYLMENLHTFPLYQFPLDLS